MNPYEIQQICYMFDKYTRKNMNDDGKAKWRHHRSYKTLEGANDAIKAFRESWIDKAYYDYPGMELEAKYPHLRPMISIKRYRILLKP